VDALLAQHIAPHVSINAAHTTGPDRRTLDLPGYRASQIAWKCIEQFFGVAVGTALRRGRLEPKWLTGMAYNLVRISRMCPAMGYASAQIASRAVRACDGQRNRTFETISNC